MLRCTQYKNTPFIIRRSDTDIVILPRKYLDELRLLPSSKLSSTLVQMENLKGKYTYGDIMAESNLHIRVLQNQLTPNLNLYLERAFQELEFGLRKDFPEVEEWTGIDIQDIIRRLVSRMSSAAFVGPSLSRNKEWLDLCVDFSVNKFEAAMIVRIFPVFMYPLIAYFLPAKKRIAGNLELAEKLIKPLIVNRGYKVKDGELPTLMDWMIQNGNEKENQLENLAARQLVLTLASIHTTSTAVSHALFDLCAHPELLEPLQKELETSLQGEVEVLGQEHLARMHLLDSFLVESQRFNPPILLTPQRIVMEPLTLSDGTHLPAGTHIAFPLADILLDDDLTPNAASFDAYRSYNMDSKNRYTYGQADKDHLSFGHGRQVCPGRQFAAAEIKAVMARFLMGHEFKFPEGGGRPVNMLAHELMFCDPGARLMVRRK